MAFCFSQIEKSFLPYFSFQRVFIIQGIRVYLPSALIWEKESSLQRHDSSFFHKIRHAQSCCENETRAENVGGGGRSVLTEIPPNSMLLFRVGKMQTRESALRATAVQSQIFQHW